MNFRERLEQNREKQGNTEPANNNELEEGFSCEYFATDNIKSLPACLDLRLPDGKRKAIPYTQFAEIDFDGSEVVEITTTTKSIKITGRQLSRLFDYLVAYRVRYVQADAGTDSSENGLFVKGIFIEDFL